MQTLSANRHHHHHVRELAPILNRTSEQAGRFIVTGGQNDKLAVEILNNVFESAIQSGSSDVHFEIDEIDGLKVRLRQGNDLKLLHHRLDCDGAKIAKTKICAKAKLDDQMRIRGQDGRMMVFFGGRRVDVRIAITPTVTGFKIVCRLLDSNNANIFLDTLEIPYLVKESLKRVSLQTQGMVLMSGPTGSGKTTTLYAILQHLNVEARHIITIENPVEYVIERFTQIEVDGNLTFADAMRSALRLDPDVIMVGEIRDEESAEIGLKASSTGHMVFSTVHANSAAATIARLQKLGLKHHDVAPVLSAMIAQRLVRRIPEDTFVDWVKPNDIEREWLSKRGLYSATRWFPRVDFSELMHDRIALIEMIEMTPRMRGIMESAADAGNLVSQIVEEAVTQPQFETLAQAGVRLAIEGKTTLHEVMKVCSEIDYIPTRRRFEQILLHQDSLQIESLDFLQAEIVKARAEGRIMSLEDELVRRGICSSESVNQAIRLSKLN